MSQEILLGLIGGVALVLAAILGAPRIGKDARSTLAKDLEMYNALPESSVVKADFLSHIERRIRQLTSSESNNLNAKRSAGQIALGITILVLAVALGLLVVMNGSWWWLASPVVLFLLLFGGVGLGLGLTKAPRDQKGNLVK